MTAISRAQAGVVQRADRWLLAAARPERLAVLRVAVGMYAVINLLVSVGEFSRLAGRSQAEFVPVGLANLLGGPVSSTTLWALFLVSLASGVAFVIGYRFELSGPVFALLTLAWVTYHSSWGQMLHFEHVLSLHLLVIGFSPAADALSADARSTRAVERTSSERYGWPVRLLAIITVVTYALAGFAKLRASGWAWVDGTTLANHIAYSATRLDLLGEPRPPLASTVINQSWMLGPMALAGIGVELLAPLALLRRFRNVWVVAVLGFHLGTLLTMFVFFPFNGLGFALLPLYRLEGVADWVRRRAGTGRYWPVSHSDGSTSLEA